MKTPLCIYHSPCADGFTAAWVVRKYFNGEVDFLPRGYGDPTPFEVEGRDVIMVDFSFKRPTLDQMAKSAHSILILDHHKTAQEDLADAWPIPSGPDFPSKTEWLVNTVFKCGSRMGHYFALFDKARSGAGLAWDFFFEGAPRPTLINLVEDRDLWRFQFDMSRHLHSVLTSHPWNFDVWDEIDARMVSPRDRSALMDEGRAIHRKLMKDIREVLQAGTRRMTIGGVSVPVANVPGVMSSEAGNAMALGEPFAATYHDSSEGRFFSLRSDAAAGMDVAAIAKRYGGGGHRNAAGFRRPIGWEGDT